MFITFHFFLATLSKYTLVPLCTKFQSPDCRNGWARFTYGGKTGWLKLHYATPCGSSKGLSFSEDENNF